MYYTVHDTSLQYAVTYNTLQVVVYISYKQSLSEDTKGLITWTGPARFTGLKNVTKIFLGLQNEF